MHPKFIVFNGQKFRLHANGYYMTENWGRGTPSTLHRAIWSFHNGPIPEGFHVHHKDGDKFNNDISNLEAISRRDHLAHHAAESTWIKSPENIEQLKSINHLAKEWHASPEGLEWHKQHGKKTWGNRALSEVKCQEPDCEKTFMTPWPNRAKYCSSACKERSRCRKNGKQLSPRRGPYKGEDYAKQS